MPTEIFPSSFKCDCGHQSDFFERTVREMRADSRNRKKEICLADDGKPSHLIYFLAGEVTAIYCPVMQKRLVLREVKPRLAPTPRQAQYLAFIYYYARVNDRVPAESDLERYFGATAPVVQKTLLALEKKGLISRVPGEARSINLLVERYEIPDLE